MKQIEGQVTISLADYNKFLKQKESFEGIIEKLQLSNREDFKKYIREIEELKADKRWILRIENHDRVQYYVPTHFYTQSKTYKAGEDTPVELKDLEIIASTLKANITAEVDRLDKASKEFQESKLAFNNGSWENVAIAIKLFFKRKFN